jgi:thiol-disulfide isomerase/thioredoxin
MKGRVVCLAGVVFLSILGLVSATVKAATAPPAPGETLPQINLPVPKDPAHREYLGLSSEKDVFQIPEIRARVVLVEIFSMYCPHCQREAPNINKLYRLIQGDPKLKSVMKIIGIGVGNSTFEVDVFRKTYSVPFPLFPDADFAGHRGLGEVRTPFFIGIRIDDDGSHQIFFTQLGGFDDPEKFLQKMLELSGLKQEAD